MNKAFLVGNLTRDPELRQTAGGVSVCTFTVAVNRRFANQQGVREADFIPIVTWRQLADLCGHYLSKGRKVSVVGSIQTRTYDAQDGSKRYATEVVADEVEFLSPAGESGSFGHPTEAPQTQPQENAHSANTFKPDQMVEADDDELPF